MMERLLANIPNMLNNNSFKFIPKDNSPSKVAGKASLALGGDSTGGSPVRNSSPGRKIEIKDGSMRNETIEESMTVKKHDGVNSVHSKNSSRYADETKFPALPNKILMLSDND